MATRKYKPSETVDFVIVGSGAAGGIMARELSRAGNSVVVMEQGPRMAPGQFEHDELKYRQLSGITNNPVQNPQTFRNDPSKRAVSEGRNSLTYARVVGGSSTHFTANFWRLHEIDFHERSVLGPISGTGFADWPISYAELEPYYTKVEWEVGVSGLAGASPFDPPRTKAYPMPPLPVKSSGVLFERGARKLGLHPFPAPMAITSVPYKGRAACVQCGLCNGFGCEVMAKSSSVWTMIPEAEATGKCEVRPDSYVFRIGMNAKGRATGVHYFDAEKRGQFQKAKAVVVCANGSETPRLLLNSSTDAFPQGLANSSGIVGKYLMFNQGGGAQALFEHPLNEFKGVAVTRILHDFYDVDPKRGYYGGGGIDARAAAPLGWGQNVPAGVPRWGEGFKEYLQAYTRSMSVSGHSTSLALETNRVDIDPELKDAWGMPAMRVTYKDHPDDLKFAAFLRDRSVEILDAAGAKMIEPGNISERRNSVHLLGTCRMGDDPRTSVIDKYHRTHDVRNLFLCDGSSFVTSGRGQPTMTIEALALRAGEHIARFARANEIQDRPAIARCPATRHASSMTRKSRTLAVTISLLFSGTALTQAPSLEARFDAAISSADQLTWMKDMASAPNHVGSPHNKANAEASLAKFRSWGWDARIETFLVLYPTPISTTVALVSPKKIKLGGQEPAIPEDPTSGLKGMLPPYVAFQGDGDVTADLVYVNYGLPEDYEALQRRGVDVRGKIAIARYGGGWRGLKPKLAQEHGAIGCLIYSDPGQDGYRIGDTYPEGGARPDTGVQRGSVADMTTYPGDPLTPGVGATADAPRLKREDAATILKIPVLPVSYGDAVKLLGYLGGPLAPDNFAGALPLAYHLGGDGKTQVHLAVKSDWSLKPAYNVIAMLKGAQYPDQWVVRGNHHDAWVMGASDPLSGNVAMLSEAKALGQLYQAGWRPKRSIVYASWDAEEPMLLGSTEWAETHAAELKAKAVIYINTDGNGRGFLFAQGSHDYQHLVNEVAKEVKDPETGATVSERLRARARVAAFDGTEKVDERVLKAAEGDGDLPIGALGSGSDYSSFLQHLGLPALNIGYGGEDESDGVYHSVYDSFHHMTTFDDPGLQYGALLSKTVGRLVIAIADSDTPPQRFSDLADTVGIYLGEVKKLAEDRRTQDEKRAKLIADGAFGLASDPLKPVGAALDKAATPHIELAPLENAVARLAKAAKAYDAAYAEQGARLTPAARDKLNSLLRDIDQLLLDERGLPGRPWYQHLIYAPGRFTGYGAKTLPGVREAIEERRFDDANVYAGRTASVLEAYAARLDQARALLEGK